jgi:hypothetical protein
MPRVSHPNRTPLEVTIMFEPHRLQADPARKPCMRILFLYPEDSCQEDSVLSWHPQPIGTLCLGKGRSHERGASRSVCSCLF